MDDSPLPASTSNLAGSWLESDGSDAAGRFDDAADNHLLVLADGPGGVRSVEMLGETFRGRIEARHLKPNFAYQLKLRGRYEDRRGFESIGYTGQSHQPPSHLNTDAST